MKDAFCYPLLVLQLLSGLAVCASELPTRAAPAATVDYMMVVTGGELLEGIYPDGHTSFLTRTLRPLGCRCVGSMVVDDRREDIFQALRFATQQVALVIVTGGLGPTPNDITREVLSEFTGIPLQENPEVLAGIEQRLQRGGAELPPNLRRQARTPQGGGYLKNPHGTAVGLVFQSEKHVIIALPGPPRELQPMALQELAPFLQRQFGARPLGSSLTLRFVGLGQSAIDQILKDRVRLPPGVVITSLFEGSRVDFTFTLPGHSEADRERLKRLRKEIAQYLGDYLYADDGASLEEKVLQLLRQRVKSMVLVEIGSAGHLAVRLNAVPGAGDILKGAYVAATEPQMRRLLPGSEEAGGTMGPERIKQMAKTAVKETDSEWAVAVSEVERDEKNTPSLWLAFGPVEDDWITHRLTLRDSGEIARAQLATQILDRLRRYLRPPGL